MTPEEFRTNIIPEGRRLYYFAFRLLNSREEAEDVVQDVMTKLWEERDRLHNYKNVPALATTMTRNKCLDRLRKMKTVHIGDEEAVMIADMADTGNAVAIEKNEAAAMIKMIVNRMKEPYKSAVIMRDMEGYSYEETAEILDVNIPALRTMLSRARKNIREELEKIYNYGTGRNTETARKVL